MAAKISLSVVSFLLLLAFAVGQGMWQQGQCHLTRINAQEPSRQIQAEGGVTEFWDHNSEEFQCAGASLHRHRIRTRGLMLPAYHNAPVLVYVLQGRAIFGIMLSGCPETFESPQQFEEGERSQRFADRHQKIRHLRKGDVLAIPAGAPHWAYNDGDQELVVVVLQDNTNNANQLDQNPRSFYLAGNPEGRQQKQQERYRRLRGEQHQAGNIFNGFDIQFLSEIFKVDQETVRKLQGKNDQRGHIVTVEKGLQVIKPLLAREEYGSQEEEFVGRREQPPYYGGSRDNGLEETICTAKLRENIDKASRADIYNPEAGRFATVNSFTLPILRFLQLSAARGVLYRNAIMAPHWLVNAHSILYATRGEARIQVVDCNGRAVFDGPVREGQVLVVPQNFAVVKKASEQGFNWVAFQTNDKAMMNTLGGRTSALRGLPVDVVANAYQVSREEAKRIKFSRRETILLVGGRALAMAAKVEGLLLLNHVMF